MNEGVNKQEAASPEQKVSESPSDKELNFRRLEAAREADRDARVRAELENQMLKREIEEIKVLLQPKEKDPLDEVEDYVDPARLKAKLSIERTALERKAKEIAKNTYQEIKKEEEEKEKKNYIARLKRDYPDYESVMNESTLMTLEQIDPIFLETVLSIPDDYERRAKTYKKIKSLPKPEEKVSIQDKVAENQQNPYYMPSGSGNPSAVEFDIRSKSARESAYAKLKAAQKRPINSGSGR